MSNNSFKDQLRTQPNTNHEKEVKLSLDFVKETIGLLKVMIKEREEKGEDTNVFIHTKEVLEEAMEVATERGSQDVYVDEEHVPEV